MPQVLSSWWLDVELREAPVNAACLPLKRSHGAEVVLKVISKMAESVYGMVAGHFTGHATGTDLLEVRRYLPYIRPM